jgi:hypothetical protein
MADFHAADLWVAIIPDASKVGPAMEEAGKQAKGKFREGVKDFGKAIHEDLDRVAAKSKDVFSGMGKELKTTFSKESFRADIELTSRQISEGFKKAGQVAGKAFNSELGQQIKQVAAEELGAIVGQKIGTAIGNSPIGQALRSAVDSAAPALDHISDVFSSIRDRDPAGTLKGVSDALRDIGQSGAAGAIDQINTKTADLQTQFGTAKGNIKETVDGLLSIAGNQGKIAGGLSAIANAAAPLAAVFVTLDKVMPGFDNALKHLTSSHYDAGLKDIFNVLVPYTNILDKLGIKFPDLGTPTGPPTPQSPGNAYQYGPGGAPPPPPPASPAGPPPGSPGWIYSHGGHASGGPIRGPGQIGKDSVFMLGAPGEHVVTAGEVNAVGGQRGMYELRGLMRSGFFKNIRGYDTGGEVGGVPDWPAIRQGESGGDPRKNTGNGYYGAYQFAQSSWELAGGLAYAPRADLASLEDQTKVAERLFQIQGPGAWPVTFKWASRGGAGGGGGHGGGGPKGSKQGLQPAASNLWDVIAGNFPQIGEIGGVRADPLPYHPSGRALDIMIPGAGGLNDPTPPGAKALGDKIYQFLMANAAALGIDTSGTLWQQKDHYNHIHAQLLDHFKGFTDASQFGGQGGGGQPAGTKEDPLYTAPGQGAGGGGSPFENQGQQLGQGLLSGLMESIGLDGSVFGGKSPLDWGAVKLGGRILNTFLGAGQGGGGGGGGAGGGGGLLGLAGLLPHAGAGAAISAAAAPAGAPDIGQGGGGSQVHIDNSLSIRDNTIKDNDDLVRRAQWEQNSRAGIGSQVRSI